MKTLWDDTACDEILARAARLRPDTRPRWGRLTCPQMLVHITDALALYTGEVHAAGRWTPLRYSPLKQAFIYLLPVPRHVPTAPELLARRAETWATEMDRLRAMLETFCGQRARVDWPVHPIFGRMSGHAYGVLAYKHTDHHLRQFGV